MYLVMKHNYTYIIVSVLILTAFSITGLITVELLEEDEDERYVSDYTVQHEFADRSIDLNVIDSRVTSTMHIYFDTQSIEFRRAPYVMRDSARHVSQQVSNGNQPTVDTSKLSREIENSDICESYNHATIQRTYPLTQTPTTNQYDLTVSQKTMHEDISQSLFSSSEVNSLYSQSSEGYFTTGTILVLNSSSEQPHVTIYTTALTCE